MPISTRELSKIAKVSEQTVRNYTRDFGALLSPAARGEIGQRLFSDEDVQIFCTIATLRKEGISSDEVMARVRQGDVYIEVTPQPTPSPQHATTPSQNDTDARSGDLLLPVALSSIQNQMNAVRADFRALQRTQDALIRAALVRGAIWGAIGALAVGGFFLWLLYILMVANYVKLVN